MIFLIGLIVGLAALWFGCEPWIVTLTTRGEQTVPFDTRKIAAIVVGVIALEVGGEYGGLLGALLIVITNLGVVVGIPAAIVASKMALKGAAARRERAIIDAQREAAAAEQHALAEAKAKGPIADIARAQGILKQRGHASALEPNAPILLPADRLFTGCVVIAPTESGKTACIAQPLAGHWLDDPRAGMIAPGIKRSWGDRLTEIAVACGRTRDQIHRIGPGEELESWPLIKGLEPDAISQFFQDAIGNQGDKYWSLAAANVIRRVAGILYHATSDGSKLCADVEAANGEVVRSFTLSYDLRSLATLAYARGDALKAIVRAARAKAEMLRPVNRRAAESIDLALESHERVMESIPEKQWGSVVNMLDAVIDPFVSNLDLARAFASDSEFDIGCLERGHVVVLDVDLSKFGATAKFVYGLARAQLKEFMLKREHRIESCLEANAILYLQDEYASYAGANDDELLRLCRAAHIASVMLYQSQSILEKEVGDKSAAAIAGAVVNKFIFRTDDYSTIKLLMEALGSADVEFESYSRNRGSSSGSSMGNNHGPQGGGNSGFNSGASEGESWSTSVQQRQVVDQQLIQTLRKRLGKEIPRDEAFAECVFIGDMGERRVADVVRVHPWSPPALPSGWGTPDQRPPGSSSAFDDVGMTCAEAWGGSGGTL